MAQVSDFGGRSQDRGRGYVAKIDKAKVLSYRCLSCGHMSFYTRVQVARMRHQPHCVACGAVTEETDASFERRAGVKKKHVAKLIGNVMVEASPGKFREDAIMLGSKDKQCRFCFKRFRSVIALKLHYEDAHDFKEEF